jgi:hypothetical protein
MLRKIKTSIPALPATILLVLMACSMQEISAQEAPAKKKWDVLLKPYFMFPNMKGTSGLKDLPDVSVNANPGDVFSHLQFGMMLYTEVENEQWAFSSDISYMKLGEELRKGTLINGGNFEAKQFMWELAGLRKISPWFDAGVGLRLNSLKSDIQVNTISGQGQVTPRVASGSKAWVDPVIIARLKTASKQKFSAQLRADIGGFGIGSKFTWQVQADAIYRFSPLFDLGLGYRVIGVNYEKGSGQERFLYDVNTFGPVIKLGFHL